MKWDTNLIGVVCFGKTEEGLGGERHLAFWVKWVEKSNTGYEAMLKRDLPFLAGKIKVIGNIHDDCLEVENET